ncbi:MAG TPA: RdgB/HAM1 family non-canonical purine NTP pyrophosphatase [Thermoguttaceae bacterium]|nr:RdgB/HAM1 family non-canonical purine NTP pyrophosphatase [Thermoguttaceae bacterium]
MTASLWGINRQPPTRYVTLTRTRQLILGTANRHKARELALLLAPTGLALASLADLAERAEVDESGGSLAENARQKATVEAEYLRKWVLADDTGLEVDALGGAPGVRSARFAGPSADAEANRRRLLDELADVPLARRTAQFVCHLALADPSGSIRAESEGRCRGRIRFAPSGDGGFGYDSLFEVVEHGRTFAELGDSVKARLSHRARAVEGMIPQLLDLVAAGSWDEV